MLSKVLVKALSEPGSSTYTEISWYKLEISNSFWIASKLYKYLVLRLNQGPPFQNLTFPTRGI
jgi:hypothetical protein